MADRYEFLPDRFTSRARAIDEWKARRGAFPEGAYAAAAVPLVIRGEEAKEAVGLWRTMVDMVPWRRLVGM